MNVSSFGLLVAMLIATQAAVADDALDIREWQVPYAESRPRDPFAESETSVWFVGQRSGYLAHLDVASGDFSQVDNPYVSPFGGAAALIEKFKGNPLFGHMTLERTVRSPLAELATTIL